MAYNRVLNALLQGSPEVKKDHKKAFSDQVERYELVSPESTNTEKEFFVPNEYEQIHHIVPLRTYDGLFANTNEEQALALAELLGSGNRIENLFVTPKRVHQAGVHNLLKDAGLEIRPKGDNSNLHPLIQQMEQSHNIPYADKVTLAKQVKKELIPLIKEELNEAMSRYGDYEGELQSAGAELLNLIRASADSPEATEAVTNTVQRMAQDILQSDKVDKIRTRDVDPNNMKRFAASPAVQDVLQEISAQRDAQAAGAVVGEKPLVVNAGEGAKVYLHTNGNGNGNGNGHAKMQKVFNKDNGYA